MSQSDRHARGARMLEEVYAGMIQASPPGQMDFMDIMVEQLFGEVWAREAMSVRDRRLLTMGVLGAAGDGVKWQIQVEAALRNGELTVAEIRESVIHMAGYAGYPKAADLIGPTEAAIAKWEKDSAETSAE